jgi:polyphosphate kinase
MENFDYIERDISWLHFNYRVLQEASDKRVPLFERLKFLAIYSSNLDEFFRVRVASLRSFKELKKKTRKELDISRPKKQLRKIRKIVQEQQAQFGAVFRGEILPELEKNGIFLIDETHYDEVQQQFAKTYFFEKIYPHIQPRVIGQSQDEAPFLENKTLYFIVTLKDREDLALIPIPTAQNPRFIHLPGNGAGHFITFLDDIVRCNLADIFDEEVTGAYSIKLSRDAELYIEDEYSGDLVEKIRKSLEKRHVGLPTRFLYDNSMPEEVRRRLREVFQLAKIDLIPGARYHNFNDFFNFPDPSGSESLHYEPLPGLPHPALETAPSILALLKSRDVMLHFPYQKYDYVPRLIWEAAEDPNVQAIKITLYRVASKSAIVDALLSALRKGKQVTAFIEAKARFDEAANLYWGAELEKAGAFVVYSYPGIKVHSKLLLIVRQEEGLVRNYAYLGTGNFNEKTSRAYCDHSLLTADPRLADEAAQVFDLLERKILIPDTSHLLVSPFTTRRRFEELIEAEIAHAREGRQAYMILKMNSLEDPVMIDKLYRAGQAGVKIQLIIRGICCLVPGVEGMSDNIEAVSIIDRFLEHARVYIFANGGREIMFIASADWMTRNLDQRVEVIAPVYDPDIYSELRHIINIQLADNTKARKIDAFQSNAYREPQPGEPPHKAQVDIYEFLKGNKN